MVKNTKSESVLIKQKEEFLHSKKRCRHEVQGAGILSIVSKVLHSTTTASD
jgi:hypothetical protein